MNVCMEVLWTHKHTHTHTHTHTHMHMHMHTCIHVPRSHGCRQNVGTAGSSPSSHDFFDEILHRKHRSRAMLDLKVIPLTHMRASVRENLFYAQDYTRLSTNPSFPPPLHPTHRFLSLFSPDATAGTACGQERARLPGAAGASQNVADGSERCLPQVSVGFFAWWLVWPMCVCEREREREKERERKREREREREKERERKREREREREKEREKLCMRLDEISALLTDSCLLSNAYHQPLQWACMHLNVYAWLRSLEFSLV
jgi:hypothetical protein